MDITSVKIDGDKAVKVVYTEVREGHLQKIADTAECEADAGLKNTLASFKPAVCELFGIDEEKQPDYGNDITVTGFSLSDQKGTVGLVIKAKKPNGRSNCPANLNTPLYLLDEGDEHPLTQTLIAVVADAKAAAGNHLDRKMQTTIDDAIAEQEEAAADGPELTLVDGELGDGGELTEPASDDGPIAECPKCQHTLITSDVGNVVCSSDECNYVEGDPDTDPDFLEVGEEPAVAATA